MLSKGARFAVVTSAESGRHGVPPSDHAGPALKGGLDYIQARSHSSTRGAGFIRRLIFGMTHSHVDAITMLTRMRRKKLFAA